MDILDPDGSSKGTGGKYVYFGRAGARANIAETDMLYFGRDIRIYRLLARHPPEDYMYVVPLGELEDICGKGGPETCMLNRNTKAIKGNSCLTIVRFKNFEWGFTNFARFRGKEYLGLLECMKARKELRKQAHIMEKNKKKGALE